MLRIVFLTLAAALIGEPVAEQTPYDSDPGKSLIPLILGTKAAQKELGLDDKQTEEIQKAVNDRIEAHIRMRKDGDVQKFVEALTNYPKAVAKVKMTLTAKQKRRLLGLEIQYAEQRNSISIFENEEVVKALKLDEKQKKSLEEIKSAYTKDAQQKFDESKKDPLKSRQFRKDITTIRVDTFANLGKKLTPEQQKIWKELRGAEVTFGFDILPSPASTGIGRLPVAMPDRDVMRAVALITNRGVQKELKFSDEQIKSIEDARKVYREATDKARVDRNPKGREKAMEDYSKALAKVRDSLSAEQKKRLLGIEVQFAERFVQVTIFKNE